MNGLLKNDKPQKKYSSQQNLSHRQQNRFLEQYYSEIY